jgi:hypothetical protein
MIERTMGSAALSGSPAKAVTARTATAPANGRNNAFGQIRISDSSLAYAPASRAVVIYL